MEHFLQVQSVLVECECFSYYSCIILNKASPNLVAQNIIYYIHRFCGLVPASQYLWPQLEDLKSVAGIIWLFLWASLSVSVVSLCELARFVARLQGGWMYYKLAECSQGSCPEKERESQWKLNYLFWPSLRSHTASLLVLFVEVITVSYSISVGG